MLGFLCRGNVRLERSAFSPDRLFKGGKKFSNFSAPDVAEIDRRQQTTRVFPHSLDRRKKKETMNSSEKKFLQYSRNFLTYYFYAGFFSLFIIREIT